jgi:hypothetical protein
MQHFYSKCSCNFCLSYRTHEAVPMADLKREYCTEPSIHDEYGMICPVCQGLKLMPQPLEWSEDSLRDCELCLGSGWLYRTPKKI